MSSLTSSEREKISGSVKRLRFKATNDKFIYPSTILIKIEGFIDGYLFIQAISQDISDSEPEISKKLTVYLNEYTKIFNEAYKSYMESQTDSELKLTSVNQSMKLLVFQNNDKITTLLNDAYSLSKIEVNSINDDISAGY